MKVLIADDSPTFRRLLGRQLSRQGFEIVEAKDGISALAILQQEDAPQLLVLDWEMPGLDGIALCRQIKAQQQPGAFRYIILLTARTNSGDIVEGLRSGADDYLTKPFDPEELYARVLVGKRNIALHAELEAVRRRLWVQETRDPLTGLLNRRALIEEVEAACGQRRELSMIMVDIDHFKSFNDQWGHRAGDEVLVAVAKSLQEFAGEGSIVGRFGGEEFVVALPGTSVHAASTIAECMCVAISCSPVLVQNRIMSVTASLGVAAGRGTYDEILARADRALYRAKDSGRNQIAVDGFDVIRREAQIIPMARAV